MKTTTRNGKSRANGTLPTRLELMAIHKRVLRRVSKMTPKERFESLVSTGIVTPDGKLSPRYGG